MDTSGFNGRQRFTLFAIYFAFLWRTLGLIAALASGWLKPLPPASRIPLALFFLVLSAASLAAVVLTERYSRGVYRYAVKKL